MRERVTPVTPPMMRDTPRNCIARFPREEGVMARSRPSRGAVSRARAGCDGDDRPLAPDPLRPTVG